MDYSIENYFTENFTEYVSGAFVLAGASQLAAGTLTALGLCTQTSLVYVVAVAAFRFFSGYGVGAFIGPEFNNLTTSICAFGTFTLLLSCSPPISLVAGLVLGFLTTHPYFCDKVQREITGQSGPYQPEKAGPYQPEKAGPYQPEKAPEKGFSDLIEVPSVSQKLQDIGSVLLDIQSGNNFYELDSPMGVLMYGPPGTGKTALTRALAHKLDASIFVVPSSDILGEKLGQTEQNIKTLFNAAITQRKNNPEKPVIIFMDEIDALGERGDSLIASRIAIPALIQWIDGYHKLPEGILFVGATNRLDHVDSALQDRLTLIETKLPTQEQREGLFHHYIGDQIPREETLSFSELAEKTDRYSCRQICDLIRDAKTKAHLDHERDPKQLKRSDFSVLRPSAVSTA